MKTASTASLTLGATGVVFGDIGTSPLYAFREAIAETHTGITEAALGTASLAIWAITIVVSIKYLTFVMRASNHGEGGILALLALLQKWMDPLGKSRFGTNRRRTLVLIALLAGAALLFGDGALTPAISVLSAVEGVGTVSPTLGQYAVPIAVVILFVLFLVQVKGTAKIGRVFGPVMIVWFLAIALFGLYRILGEPQVLKAFSPTYAVSYLIHEQWHALGLLGVVILTVTGAEALYADMGHFGLRPIRASWFTLVMPSLMLCYLGQAALVIKDPSQADNSFYGMAPNSGLTIALIALATLATVIASQALITGAFSLARQAIQLHLLPRMNILHTSGSHEGQIYIPLVNWSLGVVCIILTIAFGSSAALASAYVFAVSGTMLITTLGITVVARTQWKWSLARLIPVAGFFFVVDVAFFLSTATKIVDGGYVPVILAGFIIAIMVIWRTGQHLLHQSVRANEPGWSTTLALMELPEVRETPSFGVFLNSDPDRVPQALLTELEMTRGFPEHVLAVTVVTKPIPLVPADEMIQSEYLGGAVHRVLINAGFMQGVDLPKALRESASADTFPWPQEREPIYFLSEKNFRDTEEEGNEMGRVPESIYDFLQRNAASPTSYFKLPPRQVISIGTHMDL